MLKKYVLEEIIKSAILDIPEVSDKPNEDGSYSIFYKEINKDKNGDLLLSFTEKNVENESTDVYRISINLENPVFNKEENSHIISENKIKERIEELEKQLKLAEELYATGNIYNQKRALMSAFNTESQLDALHFVLGKKYVYRHK